MFISRWGAFSPWKLSLMASKLTCVWREPSVIPNRYKIDKRLTSFFNKILSISPLLRNRYKIYTYFIIWKSHLRRCVPNLSFIKKQLRQVVTTVHFLFFNLSTWRVKWCLSSLNLQRSCLTGTCFQGIGATIYNKKWH